MNTTDEHATHQLLDEDDCRRLMATQSVGRLVVASNSPNVRPLNFLIEGNRLFVRTDSPLPDRTEVVFEVDQIDSAERRAWSVVVRGVLHRVEVGGVPGGVQQLVAWAGDKHAWSAIDIDTFTGRWVRAARSHDSRDDRGYL